MNSFPHETHFPRFLPEILLVIITAFLFMNTIGAEFTYDDYQLIVKNKAIRYFHLSDIWSIGQRPLRLLTLMVDYRLFGLDPAGYHVHSILWHVFSVLLLYRLFLRLTADKGMSFISAALFAVHPVHVEAVANIANRKEALCMTFSLLSFLSYMNFCERRKGYAWLWFFLSFFSFYLAMHAKQVIIVLPLILIVYEYLFLPPDRRFLARNKVFIFATVVILSGVAAYEMSGIKDFYAFKERLNYKGTFHGYTGDPTAGNILLTVPKPFIQYIKLLIFPVGLSPAHYIALFTSPAELEVIISWLFFLVFLAASFLFIRIHRLVAFALFWFLIHYIPLSNVIPLTYYIAERYMYIPSAGFCLLMGYVIRQTVVCSPLQWRKKANAAIMLLTAFILIFYSIKTARFNETWSSNISLWSHDLKNNPLSFKAYIGRGLAYVDRGEYEKAIEDYSMVIRLYPENFETYNNRGNVYGDTGDYDKAIRDFTTAIRLYPENYEAYNNRGTIYMDIGAYDKAIQDFTTAIELNPEAEDCYSNRGNAYLYSGRYEKAIRDYNKAIDLWKYAHRAFYNRGVAYQNMRNYEKAMKDYNRSIEINPDFEKVYNNRGNLLNRLGDRRGALRDYSRAIELDREYEMAYFNRAMTYLKLNDGANAERDLLTVIKINSKNAEAHYKLGLISLKKYGMDKARPYFQQAAELGYKKAEKYLQ